MVFDPHSASQSPCHFLRVSSLFFFLHLQTPATFDKPDLGASCDRIDIRCSVVEVACDYTKRKHVFRLNAQSMGAELLLQAEDANSMKQWVKVLQEQTLIPPSANEPALVSFFDCE